MSRSGPLTPVSARWTATSWGAPITTISDPTLLVEPDGRLTVFWSAHNGTHMYYRTTLHPGDITTWAPPGEVRQDIPGRDGFTYPNPVLLPGEGGSSTCSSGEPTGASTSPAEPGLDSGGDRTSRSAHPGSGPTSRSPMTATTRRARLHRRPPPNKLTSVYYAAYHQGSLWTTSGQWIGRDLPDLDRVPELTRSSTPLVL